MSENCSYRTRAKIAIAYGPAIRFTCGQMLYAQTVADALLGLEVETAQRRRRALNLLATASSSVARLDGFSAATPITRLWRRLEHRVGVAQATGFAGEGAGLQEGVHAWILPDSSHDAGLMARFAEREQRWRMGPRRRWGAQVPAGAGLVAVVEWAAMATPYCRRYEPGLKIDAASATAVVDSQFDADEPDVGDLALATTIALRRAGLTTVRIGSLVGDPRAFATDQPWLDRIGQWATALVEQATSARGRFDALARFAELVQQRLAAHRRPVAVRRAVEVALWDGSIWASRLARRTGVTISSAWRSIEQAEALGLLVPIAGSRRSRGDAQLYVAPPIHQLSRTAAVVAPRSGQAPLADGRSALGSAVVEADAAIAELDRILARRVPPG